MYRAIWKIAPYLVIVILIIILFFKGCGSGDDTIAITIPESKGEFEKQDPDYVPEPEIPYVIQWKDSLIYVRNPVNDFLLKAYEAAVAENDSLTQMLLYLDAIQIRKFNNTFEDEQVKIEVEGEVQGYLNWLKPNYTIKEKTVLQEVPQTKLRVLAGFEIGANRTIDQFPLKLNLGLQNAKGNILRAGYMRLNQNDFYMAGYEFSILNIK